MFMLGLGSGTLGKYKYEIVVFLSGAMAMGLELVAARVLSPYVGSSNVVWTSIIGIILLSMSLGYWIGGKKADNGADANFLSKLLIFAAIATSLIPLLETLIVKQLAGKIENLTVVAILCAMMLFSIPCLILAMISPITVRIIFRKSKEIGSLSGKISSLDTIGSIFGTFFVGFVLIPNIGVRNINLGVSILLFFMALFIREDYNRKFLFKYIFVFVISILCIFLGKEVFKLKNPEVKLDVDSMYSRIWVIERAVNGIESKILQVDTAWESFVYSKSGTLPFSYLYYYDLFDYYNKNADNVLLIGGAAYAYPSRFLRVFEDKKIDVVEIDKKMTELAVQEFRLDINNPRLKVYTQDGRSFLNYSDNKYDAIMIDAFKGKDMPFELTTYEALINAKEMLNESGIVLTNVTCSLEGKNSDFIKYEYATYKKVFDQVKLYAVQTNDVYEIQNLILVGIKGNPKVNTEKFEFYSDLLDTEIKNYQSDKRIVTDDFVPIGI